MSTKGGFPCSLQGQGKPYFFIYWGCFMAFYNSIRFIRDVLDVYASNDLLLYIVVTFIICLAFKIIWSLLNFISSRS